MRSRTCVRAESWLPRALFTFIIKLELAGLFKFMAGPYCKGCLIWMLDDVDIWVKKTGTGTAIFLGQ